MANKKNQLKKNIRKIGMGSLAGLLMAGSTIGLSGCATPQAIQNRRDLYSQGKVNGETYFEANANNYETSAGIRTDIKFDNLKEIPGEVAGALTAFGYGFVRPFFKEFWKSGEYSGLSPFMSKGWEDGRKAESSGELTRYVAIAAGIAAVSSGGGGGNDRSLSDYSKTESSHNPIDYGGDNGEDDGGDETPNEVISRDGGRVGGRR